jgi:hypothetical protein
MPRTCVAVLALLAVACGESSPTGPSTPPPTVPPPAAQTFSLSGRITDSATGQGVSTARVQFMTGINAGRVAAPSTDGRYNVGELRAGAGLVRVYGPQHTPLERTLTVPVEGAVDFALTAAPGGSVQPPFTYRGVVWDSRGTPVSGASVTMIRDSGANPLAIVTSGGDGTFTVTTQTTASFVRVTRDGHVTIENTAPLAVGATTEVNVTLPRITRYALQAVAALRVGQSATLATEVTTDDGLTSVGRAYVSTVSSNEAVVAVSGLGNVVAQSPGTVVITAAYNGLTATVNVQVTQ